MEVKLRRGQKEFKCPACECGIELSHSRFNSGAKGSGFEAAIARSLGEAIFKDAKALCRTPLSGGLGARWPFDIYPPKLGEDRFPYGVECKFRADWDLSEILEGKRSKPSPGKRKADTFILDWWENTVTDAMAHGKTPVLIFKKNRAMPLVMTWNFWESQKYNPLVYDVDQGLFGNEEDRKKHSGIIITFDNYLKYLGEKHGIR